MYVQTNAYVYTFSYLFICMYNLISLYQFMRPVKLLIAIHTILYMYQFKRPVKLSIAIHTILYMYQFKRPVKLSIAIHTILYTIFIQWRGGPGISSLLGPQKPPEATSEGLNISCGSIPLHTLRSSVLHMINSFPSLTKNPGETLVCYNLHTKLHNQ